MRRLGRLLFALFGAALLLLLLIQLVPYGRDHGNPPVVREPGWDSPHTQELARRACFDCHSNESLWTAAQADNRHGDALAEHTG